MERKNDTTTPRGYGERISTGVPTLALALVLGIGGLARAGEVGHERARQAVESREILPLGEILSRVPEMRRSKVLSVVLVDGADGLYGWVYDISLLQEERQVLRLRIDAGTGSVLARGVGDSR